jgi:hypothetical protein
MLRVWQILQQQKACRVGTRLVRGLWRDFAQPANSQPNLAPNKALQDLQLSGITIIRTKEMARKAVALLYENKQKVHAWDTETINIEVKEESPVGKGTIICASAFCGPEVDFGNGPRRIERAQMSRFIHRQLRRRARRDSGVQIVFRGSENAQVLAQLRL